MRFTLSLLALLCVFQAVVAAPRRTIDFDTPAILSRRDGTEQKVGGEIKEKSLEQKCLGQSVWNGAIPFTSQYYGYLMSQVGYSGLCNNYFPANYAWGNCNGYSVFCTAAVNTFNNYYATGFGGYGYQNSLYYLNDKDMKSDEKAV